MADYNVGSFFESQGKPKNEGPAHEANADKPMSMKLLGLSCVNVETMGRGALPSLDCAYALWELDGGQGYRVVYYEEGKEPVPLGSSVTKKNPIDSAKTHLRDKIVEAERAGAVRVIDCLRRHQLPLESGLEGKVWIDRYDVDNNLDVGLARTLGALEDKNNGLKIPCLMKVLQRRRNDLQLAEQAKIEQDNKGKSVLEVEPLRNNPVITAGTTVTEAGKTLVFNGEKWVSVDPKPLPAEPPMCLWEDLVSTNHYGKTHEQCRGILHHLKEKAKEAKIGDQYVVAFQKPGSVLTADYIQWMFVWDGERWAEQALLSPNELNPELKPRTGIGIHGDGKPDNIVVDYLDTFEPPRVRSHRERLVSEARENLSPSTQMWKDLNKRAEEILEQQKGPEPMSIPNPTPENEIHANDANARFREVTPAEQSILDKYAHELAEGQKRAEILQLEAINKAAEAELAQHKKELKKIKMSQRKKATLVQNVSLSAVATLILYLVMSKVFGRPIPDLRLQAPNKLRKGRKKRRPREDGRTDSGALALPAPSSPPYEEKVSAPRSRVRTRAK